MGTCVREITFTASVCSISELVAVVVRLFMAFLIRFMLKAIQLYSEFIDTKRR